MQHQLLPVLLGGDMNCYSVARAFHEAYGVKSYAFGRFAMGETKYSRIVKFTVVENIDTEDVMLQTLTAFAAANPSATKVLLGCTDDYASLIIRHRDALSQYYVVPYISQTLMEKLVSKESFYSICRQYDIPYPATVIVDRQNGDSALASLPFCYPLVIKPSSSILYWKHPFEGMKKVYIAQNADEAKQIFQTIFASGYPDTLVVQDFIPGGDCGMRVLTSYSDRFNKVRMMCLGNVLLEEHTPKALGNHAAIITEYNEELMQKLRHFLDDVGYTGFANFDIKFDPRDGSYRVFEINLRQGRSNYYVTGAGLNIARYLVEDHVCEGQFGQPLLFNEETFWRSIPAQIVYEYTASAELAKKAYALEAAGLGSTALGYRYDLHMNPLRRLYAWEHNRRYFKKYETYCSKRYDMATNEAAP